MIRVGIIGFGLIGRKRANVIFNDQESELVGLADVTINSLKSSPLPHSIYITDNYVDLIKRNLDVLIVSTPNKYLMPITIEATKNKIHVLSEKPLGRNWHEAEKMVRWAKDNGVLLKTGFNHRYHPSLQKAKEIVDGGGIGEIMFIRSRYGHGGRPGYEKEWRSDKDLCGGGELLDQGVHLIDLARWFIGNFESAYAILPTYFWKISPLEDNAFVLLRTPSGKIFQFHASWTNWKNILSFEIFGIDGYLQIDGLGGSYGTEKLIWGKRNRKGGVPNIQEFVFEGEDNSWSLEWEDFKQGILNGRSFVGTGEDGLEVMKTIAAIYKSAGINQTVFMNDID